MLQFHHPPLHPSEAVDPFAAPTTTGIVMWMAGVGKTNLVVRAIAVESGSKKAIAPPMVS